MRSEGLSRRCARQVSRLRSGLLAVIVALGFVITLCLSGCAGLVASSSSNPGPGPNALSLTTSSLPNGQGSSPYSATLTASGGTAPYSWSVTSGSLPPGLTLSTSTGQIGGMPTQTGTFSFTIQVKDSSSTPQTATKAFSVTIAAAPTPVSIITQPASQTIAGGSNVSFTAGASGNPTPTVQWQVSIDGGTTFTNVAGATTTTLTFTTAVAQNGNQYRAVFTNTVGNATTTAATLTVDTAPAITVNPSNQTVTAGSNVSFAAGASGNPAPTVQWQVSSNGGAFSNVGGATSTTLTFTTTASQNGNQYRAVFSNAAANATTTAATLTVDSAPVIGTNPASQTIAGGSNVSFTAGASGNPAPTVQWQVSIDGGATFTNVAGATSTTLTFTTAVAQNGNQYRAVFTNTVGSVTSSAATLTVNTAGGASITGGGTNTITVTVSSSGSYQIVTSNPSWTFGGQVGFPLTNVVTNTGTDGVGSYQEIDFNYQASVARSSGIRLYGSKPVVLFTTTYKAAGANSQPFPVLSTYPNNPYHLSYDETTDFSPHVFNWSGINGPLLSFDGQANAFLLSAGSNFLVTQTQVSAGALLTGIDTSNISSLPQGFTHQTLLVVSPGINQTYQIWGHALTDMNGKVRPANDADAVLKYIGYITDHLMAYFYVYNTSLGYPGTLEAVKTDFTNHGIPVGYIQLDSWFYPKGCSPPSWWCGDPSMMHNGVYTFNADPAIFPTDLAGFEQAIQIPLWTQARWIDTTSPYHQQYTMSAAAITDPRYWQDRANYLQLSGVKVFEQDWLQRTGGTQGAPIIWNLTDPDAYLGNMAAAMQSHGINIQYSMPRAGHYMQSTKYNNVTTVRVSKDGFTQAHWDVELYNSQLANAVGLWPFTDGFMSTSVTDALLATLTGGLVAAGDAIGAENAANLMQAIRADGVLIKPDAPMVPLDSIYVRDAQGMTSSPMIAWTYTDHNPPMRAAYVFAFTRGTNTSGPITLAPASLGFTGSAYVYNYFTKVGTLIGAGGNFTDTVGLNGSYYVVAPVGASGIALLGETGKFVSLGKQRIAQLQDNGSVLVTVSYAANESSVTLTGYAPTTPTAVATSGSVGAVSFDPVTHLFSVAVTPGPGQSAVVKLN